MFSGLQEPTTSNQEEDIESFKKRKFDAITGEEDEDTVFQGEFKLFTWNLANSSWIENGRGQLKLNDSHDEEKKRSRLIMRLAGTLRITLNVSIGRLFKVLATSKTNVRFTDGKNVWALSGSHAQRLSNFIQDRLIKQTDDSDDEPRKKPKSQEEGEKAKEESDES